MATLKLVFDMETQDPDDFLCLLFLASHPRVQLKAVTLVPGSQEQVGLVRWALKQLDLPDVRIGAGNLAFDKEAVSPWHWRAFFPKGNCPKSDKAEEAWQVLLSECDDETVLFTGGPLTNVLKAIRRSASEDTPFRAGCWLAQGGFAGDNVVPAECRLPKFAGKTHMATFNFGANLPAARAALEHTGFARIQLVSKNVCHAESNRFGQPQLERLQCSLRTLSGRQAKGLGLIAQGMREYLKRHPDGKLLHDPLAAACALDAGVIAEWREVKLSEDRRSQWGSEPCPGSNTTISVRHDPEWFWAVFLGETQGEPVPLPPPVRTSLTGAMAAMGASGAGPSGAAMTESGKGELEKKMTKLQKALTQIEALKLKKSQGVTLERTQEGKIEREGELKAELDELSKKVKQLQGKLKHIDELREKKEQGVVLKPSQEEFLLSEDKLREELMGSSAASTRELRSSKRAEGPLPKRQRSGPAPLVDDWEGKELPKFTQPSRPHNEGLKALETLVLNPKAKPDRVLMETEHVVVAYDCFRKAKVHVLLLPKDPTLHGPDDLRAEHAPLLEHMERLAKWLSPRLRAQFPGLPPLRCGFHAVPSMRHLHLHLISLDFDSVDIKKPRHWIIFNSEYLVPPWRWARQLEAHGRVFVDKQAEMARVKGKMKCPLTNKELRGSGEDMHAVRQHLGSSLYQEAVRGIKGDMVFEGQAMEFR